MSAEREQMKVKLTNLEYRQKELTEEIKGLCETLRNNLNTLLHPVEDLPVPESAGQMDDLVTAWGELQGTLGEIGRLKEELE